MAKSLSLFKVGRTGYFYIQWTENGIKKQMSTRCKKKAEALLVLREFKGKTVNRHEESITWKAYRKEYEGFSKGYHTASSHRTVVDGFNSFEKFIGHKAIDLISVREMDQYITHLKTKISIQTARKHYITLAAAFQKAVEWGYLENNYWRKVKKPTTPQIGAPFITMDDFMTVCSAVHHPEVRTIATVAFHTGMRRGEIMCLRWSSIDFENRTIKIQNTDTFTTKSKKQRIVPMNGECYAALMEQQHRQTNEVMVFSVQPDLVQHQFKRACRLIFGNATNLHFHSLRHSFCSNLVRQGADIKVVQALAGHSSIEITEKYTHYLRSDAVKAVDLLMSKEEQTTRTIVPCIASRRHPIHGTGGSSPVMSMPSTTGSKDGMLYGECWPRMGNGEILSDSEGVLSFTWSMVSSYFNEDTGTSCRSRNEKLSKLSKLLFVSGQFGQSAKTLSKIAKNTFQTFLKDWPLLDPSGQFHLPSILALLIWAALVRGLLGSRS